VRSPRKPPTARRSRLAARPRPCGACVAGARRAVGPFSPAPVLLLGKRSPSVGWCVRPGSHRSPRSALRVARDRPFRACGRSPHRPRPFRAKMNLVSTPALHPFGSSGPRLRRPRRTWLRRGERGMRWPLAPGGSARGAGWGHLMQARSLARAQRGAREGASESAQMVLSVGVRKPRCSSIAVSARTRLRSL